MTLVIVHIPKAAGTSLKEAISESVGADNVYSDYKRPLAKRELHRNLDCLISSNFAQRSRKPVVFGHFLVGKYAQFRGVNFIKRKGFAYVIFLRDPLQRAISHYYFWQRTYVGGHRLWEQFTREKWNLERFLLSRQHTNFQSKFVWRFPLRQFDFIGIAENYEDSIEMLGRAFPILKDLPIKSENNNPKKLASTDYRVDRGLAIEFKRRNKLDYRLYSQALEIFGEQRSRFPQDSTIP